MAQNAEEIVVAAQGSINVATVTDTLVYPTTEDETLDSAFAELGYATEDGVTFTATPNVEDINAWQAATPVRRLVTARALTLATQLEQWNEDTFAIAFGGGEWSESGTTFRYDPPADTDALVSLAVVIDAQDGDRKMRWVVYRTNVTEAVETNLTRTAAAVLPVTFSALTPDDQDRAWYYLSDDAAFGS